MVNSSYMYTPLSWRRRTKISPHLFFQYMACSQKQTGRSGTNKKSGSAEEGGRWWEKHFLNWYTSDTSLMSGKRDTLGPFRRWNCVNYFTHAFFCILGRNTSRTSIPVCRAVGGKHCGKDKRRPQGRSVNELFWLKCCSRLFQAACWELTWHSECVCIVQLAKNNSVWTQVKCKTKQPWHGAVKVNIICNHSKHFHWYHIKITSGFPSAPKCPFFE